MPYRLLGNRLIAALTVQGAAGLLPHLEQATLRAGQRIAQAGAHTEHVYFPTRSLISLQYVAPAGGSIELGVVGSDGVVDVAAMLGHASPHDAVVQVGGDAIRIRSIMLRRHMAETALLQPAVLDYVHCLMAQISQISACNHVHSLAQRFCRWLLVRGDCLDAEVIPATQDAVAHLLGVRRESVNHVASALHDAGVLQCSRGTIRILDRARLEAVACECHRLLNHWIGAKAACTQAGAGCWLHHSIPATE